MLQYDYGMLNRTKRKAFLQQRAVATAPDAAALRSQLDTLQALLAVSADDFSCALCAVDAAEFGAVLELGTREVAARMAAVRVALPPGADTGKVVAAAPRLLLHADVGAKVTSAMAALAAAAPLADVPALALQRPGSFGNVLAELAARDNDMGNLSPFRYAWVMGARRGQA